jgi:hypothetical protein
MAMRFGGMTWFPSDLETAAGYDITIGTFNSTTAGYGKALSSAKTKSLDVCCDDAGKALTAGTAYRAIRGRTLLTYAQSGDTSIFGIQGHLKNTAVDTSTGNKAGLWGYYESISGATIAANSCGVYGMIDLPVGATAGGVVAGVMSCSNDLRGTNSGSNLAAFHVPNPVAGTWDYGIVFGTATGATTANTAKLGTDTCIAVLNVRVGATPGYIPILAAVPSGS